MDIPFDSFPEDRINIPARVGGAKRAVLVIVHGSVPGNAFPKKAGLYLPERKHQALGG
jgi:hypothetical protein